MKVKVVIQDQTYDVEVNDLRARPVIAVVDGKPYEVWPEMDTARPGATLIPTGEATPPVKTAPVGPSAQPQAVAEKPAGASTSTGERSASKVVRAPIPGVILSIAVQAGDNVTQGQVLCVLEAMKMNNTIRSSQAGQIGAVKIVVGQHVKHSDVLIEFAG